jgi:hypothetical protein
LQFEAQFLLPLLYDLLLSAPRAWTVPDEKQRATFLGKIDGKKGSG